MLLRFAMRWRRRRDNVYRGQPSPVPGGLDRRGQARGHGIWSRHHPVGVASWTPWWLRQQAGQLHVLSPLATLERGYAIIEDVKGQTKTKVAQVRDGDVVRARLQDGVLNCEVRSIETAAEYRSS